MSPLIFQTPKDHLYDTEIAGVGVIGGQGRGGIPVERAAENMPELQDDKGRPLSGKKLEDAANAWAERRGLRVTSRKTLDEEQLRVDAGAFPRGPSIEEVSARAVQRDYGYVEAHDAPGAAPLTPAQVPVQETAILPNAAEGPPPPGTTPTTPTEA